MKRLTFVLILVLTLALGSCSSPTGQLLAPSVNAAPSVNITVSGSGVARTVTMSGSGTVYYTVDGSEPTAASAAYTAPLTVAGIGVTKTIKALAVASSQTSAVSSKTVTITPFALNLSADVSVFAGADGSSTPQYASGNLDGTGTAARFNAPLDVTSDGTNLYVIDNSNNSVRKVVVKTGEVSTLAGGTSGTADGIGTAAQFDSPWGITTDGMSLYVTDTNNATIRQIDIATRKVTTLAGSGAAAEVDGKGTAASFRNPVGVTTDGTNLYVCDSNGNTIRMVVIATGEVSTLAGSNSAAGFQNDFGTAALFTSPWGITTDGTNLYVADRNNNAIRKIVISTGEVSTLAGGTKGNTYSEGTGPAAGFLSPQGMSTDGTNLYVADANNFRIRKVVINSALVSTLAGNGGSGTSIIAGNGTSASLDYLYGLTTDGTSLFCADDLNSILKVQ